MAAARKSNGAGNRPATVVAIAAIVVIIGIITWGVWNYGNKTAVPEAGYGSSASSVASVDKDGVILISSGSASVTLDVYEDALCPACGNLEQQFGEQMAKAVDGGELALRFSMVDFLNGKSASGDYSTRAAAALHTVAAVDGDTPGVWVAFHAALFSGQNQPREYGSTDLNNEQLAKLAGDAGASAEAQERISAGGDVNAAQRDGQTHLEELARVNEQVGRGVVTPTVAYDGAPISVASPTWLTDMLAEHGAGKPTK